MIYISGTVARDVSPEGIRRVYAGLQKTLEHYGATFQNVVKENLYTTDIEAMKQHNAVRKAFYKGDFPAATWVQINRLYMGCKAGNRTDRPFCQKANDMVTAIR